MMIFLFSVNVLNIIGVTNKRKTHENIVKIENSLTKTFKVMAIPNIDTLYECGSTLSAAKAADYAKVRNHQIFIFIIAAKSALHIWSSKFDFFSSMKASTKRFFWELKVKTPTPKNFLRNSFLVSLLNSPI